MEEDVLEIDCGAHGKKIAAAVCGHLVHNNGTPLGFIENSSDPNDLQAWCLACEHVFLNENDKTEKFRSFCHHSIVCVDCYSKIKEQHDVYA